MGTVLSNLAVLHQNNNIALRKILKDKCMKEAKEQDINFADILWIFEGLNFLLIDRWSFSNKEATFLMVEKARKTQFDRKDWNILKEQKLQKDVDGNYWNFTGDTYLQLMRYKEYGFAFSGPPNGFTEDMGAHTGINSTERVIQEKNGPLTVECTRQAHSLTLPSTQVGTPLANLKRENKNTFCTKLSSCWGWIKFIA